LREGQAALERSNAITRQVFPAAWAEGQTIHSLREELRRLESQRNELLRERPELADESCFRMFRYGKPLGTLYAKVAEEIEIVKAELIRRGERLQADKRAASAGGASPLIRTVQPGAATEATKHKNSRKGDSALLNGKESVSFRTAEHYLGIGERQRQSLIKRGCLNVVGQAHNRRITTGSLRMYLPPTENPN
jgi:hypothetical protein